MRGEYTQWHYLVRANTESSRLAIELNLAIPAQSVRVDLHRLHHRAPAVDRRTLCAQARHSILNQGDIRRCSANVGHQHIIHISQELSAHNARCRAGENGFDGRLPGKFGTDQGTVTPNHHERSGNCTFFESPERGSDQILNQWNQSCINQRGQCTARSVE